jgi:hypothetical protein
METLPLNKRRPQCPFFNSCVVARFSASACSDLSVPFAFSQRKRREEREHGSHTRTWLRERERERASGERRRRPCIKGFYQRWRERGRPEVVGVLVPRRTTSPRRSPRMYGVRGGGKMLT